jgi:sorbitol-specific phosphotransferase system component IIBC
VDGSNNSEDDQWVTRVCFVEFISDYITITTFLVLKFLHSRHLPNLSNVTEGLCLLSLLCYGSSFLSPLFPT